MGLSWGTHLFDLVRLRLWVNLVRLYFPTDVLDDENFRIFFEEHWKALLHYRGVRFDFRIVPGLSPDAFVRYQKLPYGDRTIRNIVSSYIVHQATAYPHLSSPLLPDLVRPVYLGRLREMYAPAVQKAVKQVLAGLTRRPEVTRAQARAEAKKLEPEVTRQAWDAYAEAVTGFRFHVPYSGHPSPLGLFGVLGLAESPADRESFDAFLKEGGAGNAGPWWGRGKRYASKARTSLPVLFSRYLNSRLYAWRQRICPPEARTVSVESLDRPAYGDEEGPTLGETLSKREPVSGAGGWPDDTGAISSEEPAVVGPDGTAYLTIEQVARQQRASLSQLRHLEQKGLYMPVARQGPSRCLPAAGEGVPPLPGHSRGAGADCPRPGADGDALFRFVGPGGNA